MLYAEVIIPLALPKNYTWSVPDHMQEAVQTGCRVEVNLGKNKRYAGVIKRLHSEAPTTFEAKDILNLLDPEPVVQPFQLRLWAWIAEYYMCSEGEVMAAALPSHFKLSSETVLMFNEEYGDDFSGLSNEEYVVAEALLIKHELRLSEVQQLLDVTHVYPIVNRLIGKKVCFVWEALKQTYAPKKETFILLNPEYGAEEKLSQLLNNWSRAPKQLELLLAYLHLMKTIGEVSKAELLKKSNASEAQLKGLVEKGILQVQKRNIDRVNFAPKDVVVDFQFISRAGRCAPADARSLANQTGVFTARHYLKRQNPCVYKTHGRVHSARAGRYCTCCRRLL
jgi:primosomal protein N' (replication factor Y)